MSKVQKDFIQSEWKYLCRASTIVILLLCKKKSLIRNSMNFVKEQISWQLISVLVSWDCCNLITLASCALLQDEPRHIGESDLRHRNNSLMTDVVVSNIPKAISDLLVSTMHAHTWTHCGSMSPFQLSNSFVNSYMWHVHWMYIEYHHKLPLSKSINQQHIDRLIMIFIIPLGRISAITPLINRGMNEKEVFIHKVKNAE